MAQMVYVDGLATPGNFTTSGSANTEVGAIDFKSSADRRKRKHIGDQLRW